MGGGSGGGGATTSTTNTSNLPEYARPYFERMMERAEAESNQDYVGYGKDRIAGTSQDTQSGYDITRNLAAQGTPVVNQAIGAASGAGSQGIGDINAARSGVQSTMGSLAPNMDAARSASYAAMGSGAGDVSSARNLANQATIGGNQAGEARFLASDAAKRGLAADDYKSNAIQQSAFTGEKAGQYMSPYMENVMEQQRKGAIRNFEEGRSGRETAAIKSGAFGGYRSAIQEGVAQRGLSSELNAIEATGRQKAFENAQAQYERDRAASMQAQATTEQQRLAGEQYGLQGASLGLQGSEALSRQGLAQQGMSLQAANSLSQMAAQQQGLGLQQAGLMGQLAGQQGQLGLQAAQNQAALGLGQQQFGLQQAGVMGQLAAQQQGMTLQQAQALQAQGGAQQQQEQRYLDQGYQDFLNQQGWDKQQINYMSQIMRGIPVQPSTVQNVYSNPNPLAQYGGLGIAGLGLMRSGY